MKQISLITKLFDQLSIKQTMLTSGGKEGIIDTVRSIFTPVDEFICVSLFALVSISIVPVLVKIKEKEKQA